MSKHTPGPWVHAGYARSMAFRVTKTPDDPTGDVCNVLAGLAAKTNGEVEANARLIAAAPELLEALLSVLHWIDDNCETTGFEAVEAMADAALAKAGAELFNAADEPRRSAASDSITELG